MAKRNKTTKTKSKPNTTKRKPSPTKRNPSKPCVICKKKTTLMIGPVHVCAEHVDDWTSNIVNPQGKPKTYYFTCPCCRQMYTGKVSTVMPCPVCVDKMLIPYTNPDPRIMDLSQRERVMVELDMVDGMFFADIGKIAGATFGQYTTMHYAFSAQGGKDITLNMSREEFMERITTALKKADETF